MGSERTWPVTKNEIKNHPGLSQGVFIGGNEKIPQNGSEPIWIHFYAETCILAQYYQSIFQQNRSDGVTRHSSKVKGRGYRSYLALYRYVESDTGSIQMVIYNGCESIGSGNGIVMALLNTSTTTTTLIAWTAFVRLWSISLILISLTWYQNFRAFSSSPNLLLVTENAVSTLFLSAYHSESKFADISCLYFPEEIFPFHFLTGITESASISSLIWRWSSSESYPLSST